MEGTAQTPRRWIFWRRLVVVALAGVGIWFGLALFEELVSADLRWGLWVGGACLFALAAVFGARRYGAWSPWVLAAPILGLYAIPMAGQLRPFWPFAPLWAASALVGWWWAHGRGRTGPVATAVVAVALAGYGGWVIPDVLSAALNTYVDEPAPEIELANLDGTPYPMESLRGKVVVLDFFATWCVPCRAELPELEAVRRALADRDDIVFLVVGDGDSGDTIEQVAEFAEGSGLELPFVWDPEGRAHDAFEFWNIPALAVIDRGGRVRLKRVGYNSAEVHFAETLERLLLEL